MVTHRKDKTVEEIQIGLLFIVAHTWPFPLQANDIVKGGLPCGSPQLKLSHGDITNVSPGNYFRIHPHFILFPGSILLIHLAIG